MKLRTFATLVGAALLSLAPSLAHAQLTGYEEYYIPGREEQIRAIFRSFSTATGNTMHTVISVTAGSDGTKIYYDHWENGYAADPVANPDEVITLNAGQSHVFESSNVPANPRGTGMNVCGAGTSPCYDGGDRIFTAGRNVAVTHATWAETPGPNEALVWEVYPVLSQGSSYIIPIGEDFASPPKKATDFNQVFVTVMSLEDGNNIQIDDLNTAGNPNASFTLNRGEVNSGANAFRTKGIARVTSTNGKKMSVQFVAGINQGGNDDIRSLNVPPTTLFGTDYISPVPSFASTAAGRSANTDLYIHNPNAFPISVTVVDSAGTVVIPVAASDTETFSNNSPGNRFVSQFSGAHLFSNQNFWRSEWPTPATTTTTGRSTSCRRRSSRTPTPCRGARARRGRLRRTTARRSGFPRPTTVPTSSSISPRETESTIRSIA